MEEIKVKAETKDSVPKTIGTDYKIIDGVTYKIIHKKGELYPENKIMLKGIVPTRREHCKYKKDFYLSVLMSIMNKRPRQETLDIIVDQITKLKNDEVSLENLIMVKQLGAAYKSENYSMKLFGEELAKIGKPAQPGDRLEYVIVKSNMSNKYLGLKMRLPELYLDGLKSPNAELIDVEYYFRNLLAKQIEQLWKIGYKGYINERTKYNKIEDYINIIRELTTEKNLDFIQELTSKHEGNPMKIFDELLLTNGYKTKTKASRCKFISGRKVVETRINGKPFTTLIDTMNTNDYNETLINFSSDELLKRRFPELSDYSVHIIDNRLNTFKNYNIDNLIKFVEIKEIEMVKVNLDEMKTRAKLFLVPEAYQKVVKKMNNEISFELSEKRA